MEYYYHNSIYGDSMTTFPIEKPAITDEKMAQTGLKAFFKIAESWGLNPQQQKTILGIFKALQILLPNEKSSDDWVKKPNAAPLFGGRSALDRMLSGNVGDLYEVRKYLDAQRGGWA